MDPRPNLLVVITDDQGYGDLGCLGNPQLQTPHLDALHGESVRLTDFHVGPTCAPTRASLLTGHHANSTGVWHTIGGRSLLREHEWTLADALRDHGYRTGLFGKWHLGDAPPYRPEDRGFDTVVRHGGGGISQTPDYWGNDYFDDTYFVDGEPKRFEGYCTDVWFDCAMDFAEHAGEAPYFCWLAPNAPHGPLNVEDRWVEPYRAMMPEPRARFFGMIANIDHNVGRLRRRLAELGQDRDTVLVFMTDNGTASGCDLDAEEFVTDGYNAGMRGIKGSPYDGGHRVPVFIHYPAGGLTDARDVTPPAHAVDFMPTMLELCGATPPADRRFHGTSIAPSIRGGSQLELADRLLVTDSQRVPDPVKWKDSCVIFRRWRLIRGQELYDLETDPEQRRDVAGEHPDLVTRLREGYEQWWALVGDRFEQPIPFTLPTQAGERVRLTAHDWRNDDCVLPWNQGMIRNGLRSDGAWEIRVDKPGRYRFALYRWPSEAGHAVTDGIDGDDVAWRRDAVAEDSWTMYTGGVALTFEHAHLTLGQQTLDGAVPADAACVEFEMDLADGATTLAAAFSGTEVGRIGAYYVEVERA